METTQCIKTVLYADKKAAIIQIITLSKCSEQKSIWEHYMLNLEVDDLQKQKTALGSTSVNQGRQSDTIVGTDPQTGQLKIGKNGQVTFFQSFNFQLNH